MSKIFFRMVSAFLLIPICSISQIDTMPKPSNHLYTCCDSILQNNNPQTLADLGQFCSPFRGKVISHFGPRHGRFHAGTDIKLQLGDTVRAAFAGIVTRASKYYGYGLLVVLKNDSLVETYYAHLSKILVKVGDTVAAGSTVGLGGRTGRATTTHLHFEFRVKHIALDAEKLFDFKNQLVLAKNIPTLESGKVNDVAMPDSVPNYDSNYTLNIGNPEHSLNEEVVYTIKRKDTLYSLAKRYGTTVDGICALNSINPKATLRIGQKIRIRV